MRRLVKYVLFTMMLTPLSFTAGFAQESIIDTIDTVDSCGVKPWFYPDGFIEDDTIINHFKISLSCSGLEHYQIIEEDSILLIFKEDTISYDAFIRDSVINPLLGDCDFKLRDTDNPEASDDELQQALEVELKDTLFKELPMKKNEYDKQKLVSIIVFIGCAIIIVCLVVIVFSVLFRKKKSKAKNTLSNQPVVTHSTDDNAGLEIRHVTTAVLRKQSLEDVANNVNYLVVEGKEFSDNTAIGKMYIKNECIKGIHDMYAEDIRKSENPNENGCMVLGRWVYNSEQDKYDVSLEELMYPGDDAVFSQYEIHFGGKIKMKIFERLKKLRQETDLQYDVTCWVHSHPNLGVFFSNSDCNVQTQLKHPTHPNFLTAIVVDILTPTQELGIFTFQQDGSINSKVELKRLYSLKEWYNWATGNENSLLNHEDYYDTLSAAQNHYALCKAIYISDKTITDIYEVAVNNDETMRLIDGSSRQIVNGESEFVADKLSDASIATDKDNVGAFVVDLYCSIPSVRKMVADYLDEIKFVLVYSTSNKKLTSIPIVNNDLCEEISCYGEQELEDLILWTKRKR